jgi:hypothetical protein
MQFHWKPTNKQTEALVRPEYEILFGGSRGGGKTDAGQAWLLYDIGHPKYRSLVIRKNANDLNDWISRAKLMYKPTNADFVKGEIRFPSGATIILGHLKDENAYEKYQGHEYHKMLIEELTQIPTEESYLKLISSCRSTIPELIPQIFSTTNPGGRGHKWVKKRFRLEGNTSKIIVTTDEITGRTRVFVPARVDDNPYIMKNDPGYVNFLNGLPDGLRQAWREGSWQEVEIKGAYYAAMYTQAKKEGRIGVFPYDPSLPVYTVWDLGVGKNLSIGFYQRTTDWIRMIDYWEGTEKDGIPQAIKACREKPYIYGRHFAPHDIGTTDTGTGVTRKDTALGLGWEFETIPKLDLDDGINAGQIMFARLRINEPTCEQFLSAIWQYRKEWDERLLTFKNHPLHDWASHPADVHRYAAISETKMVPKNFIIRNYREEESKPLYSDIGI